jgi:hypothetical protein
MPTLTTFLSPVGLSRRPEVLPRLPLRLLCRSGRLARSSGSRPALERRNHWEKTSHSLLVGAILHVLYAESDKTLAGVANFLSDPKRPIDATLRAMMTTPHLGARGVHPVVASAARELLNKSENERSGVLSTAMSFLGLYRDPVVAEVTSRCDLSVYLDPALSRSLVEYVQRRGKSKSLVAEAAIGSFLSPDAAERQEAAMTRRLDQLVRRMERLHRDVGIVAETIALFIRFWLLATPQLPNQT